MFEFDYMYRGLWCHNSNDSTILPIFQSMFVLGI